MSVAEALTVFGYMVGLLALVLVFGAWPVIIAIQRMADANWPDWIAVPLSAVLALAICVALVFVIMNVGAAR